MPTIFKNENELIRKWIVLRLKEKHYLVRKSVKISQCLNKLKSEEAATEEEIDIKHSGQPDIDIVFWEPKEEPIIQAAEVKYFRLTEKGMQPVMFFDGLHEALLLLTYGFDYIYLWHFYDPTISEKQMVLGSEVMETLVKNASLPICYQALMITSSLSDDELKNAVDKKDWSKLLLKTAETFQTTQFTSSIYPYFFGNTIENPLINLQEVKKRRKIVRRALRIV